MESGGRIAYQEKTGWVGRAMKLAKLQGNGLALSLPMPLLLRGVPKNNNYYPADGILPRKETLELLTKNNIPLYAKSEIEGCDGKNGVQKVSIRIKKNEIINKNNGIIIQRLINPDIMDIIIEPNILIHYCDCQNNPNMFLNIGASRNKNIKIAKQKLKPYKLLKINRQVSKKKFIRNDWIYFKQNLQ